MQRALKRVILQALQQNATTTMAVEHPLKKAHSGQVAFEKIMQRKGEGVELLREIANSAPSLPDTRPQELLKVIYGSSHIMLNTDRMLDVRTKPKEVRPSPEPIVARNDQPMTSRERQQQFLHMAAVNRAEDAGSRPLDISPSTIEDCNGSVQLSVMWPGRNSDQKS